MKSIHARTLSILVLVSAGCGGTAETESSNHELLDEVVIQQGCGNIQFCNAPGSAGTICRQTACSGDLRAAIRECIKEDVPNVCGGPTREWVYEQSGGPAFTLWEAVGYSANDTASATNQNSMTLELFLPKGFTYDFGTCAVPGASATGDTYLRMDDLAGGPVAENDDAGPGFGLASRFTFTPTDNSWYRLHAGCYADDSCSGTVAWRVRVPQ